MNLIVMRTELVLRDFCRRPGNAGHRRLVAFVLLVTLGLNVRCHYDHGIDPIITRVSGNVIFMGKFPDPKTTPVRVREVRVALVKRFPPENLVTDLVYSDELLFSKDTSRTEPDTIHYELSVEAGTYAAAGVLWRESGKPWDIANIIGIYTDPNELTPKPIVVKPDSIVDGIDIIADWSLTWRDAIIEGDITFVDPWPRDTEIVAVAFFPIIPRTTFDFLKLRALDINVKKDTTVAHYRTRVGSGTYKFIALFWKGKKISILESRAIGFYRCETDSLRPKPVVVETGGERAGVDFKAYFSTLPHGVNFKKDEAPCPPAE